MYDSCMRTRGNVILSVAASILGGVLSVSSSIYAQSTPVISLTKEGGLYLNKNPVNIHRLANEIRRISPTATEIYFRPDKQTSFDSVTQVLAELNKMAKPPISVKLLSTDSK